MFIHSEIQTGKERGGETPVQWTEPSADYWLPPGLEKLVLIAPRKHANYIAVKTGAFQTCEGP